jgi:Na+:H+ antiporter, NhaA family
VASTSHTDPVSAPPPPAGPTLLPRPLREFLDTEVAGAAALFLAVVVALVWANSPWFSSYETLWHTTVDLQVGSWTLDMDLHQVVNDGLMTIFFFVVGLEIKRELVEGELSDPRAAAVPAVAALGGMVVPALLFVAINASTGTARGWGIPMATDIAFALGVVALVGTGLPAGVKLFLLTLAIVDDVGAILVIAIFYSTRIEAGSLLGAALVLGLIVACRVFGVQQLSVYVVLGLVLWLLTFESGVHATIAGVALGLLTPARSLAPASVARRWATDLDDEPSAEQIATMTTLARSSVSVAERLEYRLHPVSSYLIIPLFALANAGVRLNVGALSEPGPRAVAVGIVVGLVVGKTVGISGFTWVAVRSGLGRLPEGMHFGHLVGVAAVAGIGFTVSLFITELAYVDPTVVTAAKTAILAASALAAVVGGTVLAVRARRRSARAT